MKVSGLERRKLFAYTVMFISGILAGYFAYEKLVTVPGVLFLLATGVWIRTTGSSARFIYACLCFLAAGFLLFTINYISSEYITDEIDSVTSIEGIVVNYTKKEDKLNFILRDSSCEIDGNMVYLGKVQATYYDEYTNNLVGYIGCRLSIQGKLSRPEPASNPGCFDYRIYLKSKGIKYLFRIYNISGSEDETDIANNNKLTERLSLKNKRLISRCREGFLEKFADGETRGFIRGVVFGDKSEIDEDSIELFNSNSTGHILAVSGLHVGFLYSLIRFVSGRRRDKMSVSITIFVLFIYGEMTMWSASTIRAVLVLSMSLLSRHVRRPFDLLTSVSTAALIILVNNPYQLFNSGFQLSFMALTSIAFLSKPLSVIIGERFGTIVAVQFGVLPLVAYQYNRVNLLSLFINIPVIALASIIVPFYLLILLIYIATGGIPSITITISEGLERMMILLNRILEYNGSFSNRIVSMQPSIIIFMYLIAFFVFSEWFRVKYFRSEWRQVLKASICICLASAFLFSCTYNRFMDDDIVFVAVGQGSCIHLRTPSGRNILIDGGGRKDYNVGAEILQPYLLKNGVARVDLALATHMDMDHYKGLEELSELGMVDRLITNRDGYRAGDTIYEEEGFRITVAAPINPDKKTLNTLDVTSNSEGSTTAENENSLVFRVDYDDLSLLATGDIGKDTEGDLVDYWKRSSHGVYIDEIFETILDTDILAVPHHGSKNSSSEKFIEAVSPTVAVIQVGKNNNYGHPAPETLDTYNSLSVPTYRNDLQGAIGIERRHKHNIRIDILERT